MDENSGKQISQSSLRKKACEHRELCEKWTGMWDGKKQNIDSPKFFYILAPAGQICR
jgi:hypothetical protein